MAEISGREFSQEELVVIFRTLDTGGTRADVRADVRRLQGRGVSNEVIRKLRDVHRTLRRSQGFNVKQGGTRNLRNPDGSFKRWSQLRSSERLPLRARPVRVPTVVTTRRTVEYGLFDSRGRMVGTRIRVFTVGPDTLSLAEQVAEAKQNERPQDEDSAGVAARLPDRGYQVLQVRT